jgi:hypothetical protein
MMAKKKRLRAFLLLIVFSLSFFLIDENFAQQVSPEKQSRVEKKAEKTVASPKTIKEATRIYVFVGWMWLAIFVLLYFLRLKIKEVDRLYHLQYFSAKKK